MEVFSVGSMIRLDGTGIDGEQREEDDDDLADVKRRECAKGSEVGWTQHEQEQKVELRQLQRQRKWKGE